MIKFKLYVSEIEICALIDRYDRTRDGKINYTEFVEELNPRTGKQWSIKILFYFIKSIFLFSRF